MKKKEEKAMSLQDLKEEFSTVATIDTVFGFISVRTDYCAAAPIFKNDDGILAFQDGTPVSHKDIDSMLML